MLDPNNKEISKLITTQITAQSVILFLILIVSGSAVSLSLFGMTDSDTRPNEFRIWVSVFLVSAPITIVLLIMNFLIPTSAGEMQEALGIVNSDTEITIPTEKKPVALINVEVREGNDTVHYDYATLVRDGDTVTLVPNE